MSSPHLGTFEWSRGGTSLLFRQQCSAYSPPAQEMASSQFRINTWLIGGRIWPQGQSSLFVFNGNTRQLEFKISESHTRSISLSAKGKNIWTAADLQAVSFFRNLRCKWRWLQFLWREQNSSINQKTGRDLLFALIWEEFCMQQVAELHRSVPNTICSWTEC